MGCIVREDCVHAKKKQSKNLMVAGGAKLKWRWLVFSVGD